MGRFSVPVLWVNRQEVKDLLKVYEFGEVYSSGDGELVGDNFHFRNGVNRKSDLVLYY